MDIKDIKITTNEISYTKLADIVQFVVDGSFSKADGQYHKYLRDYYETLGILIAFTNFSVSEGLTVSDLYDEVMSIRASEKWNEIVKSNVGVYYWNLVDYVNVEIENKTRPLAEFNNTLASLKKAIDNINSIIEVIDVDKIKDVDFSKLIEAFDAISAVNNTATDNTAETDKQNV